MQTVELRYHGSVFARLGRTPVWRPERAAAIDERERQLGVVIPASVREWYMLEWPPEYRHDTDQLETLIVEDEWETPGLEMLCVSPRFKGEPCGGPEYAVVLDTSADPPVWCFEDSDDLDKKIRVEAFGTFSAMVEHFVLLGTLDLRGERA